MLLTCHECPEAAKIKKASIKKQIQKQTHEQIKAVQRGWETKR